MSEDGEYGYQRSTYHDVGVLQERLLYRASRLSSFCILKSGARTRENGVCQSRRWEVQGSVEEVLHSNLRTKELELNHH